MSTFDEIFGADPNAAAPALAGPGTVKTMVPAALDPNMRGLQSLHPGKSPTPWVIGMALLLVLLMHEKAGFGGSASVRARL